MLDVQQIAFDWLRCAYPHLHHFDLEAYSNLFLNLWGDGRPPLGVYSCMGRVRATVEDSLVLDYCSSVAKSGPWVLGVSVARERLSRDFWNFCLDKMF